MSFRWIVRSIAKCDGEVNTQYHNEPYSLSHSHVIVRFLKSRIMRFNLFIRYCKSKQL